MASAPAQIVGGAPAEATLPGTGVISGRIYNPASGEYVRNAEARVPGTNLLVFSGTDGSYRISAVPAGTAMVSVTYSGYRTGLTTVDVMAGQVTAQDFELQSAMTSVRDNVLAGVAPSLVDSSWVSGCPETLVRILLHGKEGTPGFAGGMPPVLSFADRQIAGLVTYILKAWGRQAGAVDTELVTRVRQETLLRHTPWTDAELEKIK